MLCSSTCRLATVRNSDGTTALVFTLMRMLARPSPDNRRPLQHAHPHASTSLSERHARSLPSTHATLVLMKRHGGASGAADRHGSRGGAVDTVG
jgi:hypothetical protein